MPTLFLASTSSFKISQFRELLMGSAWSLEPLAAALPEVQSLDVAEVSYEKARAIARSAEGRILVVDDVGMSLPSLRGFPGALLKLVLDLGGLDLLERMASAHDAPGRVEATYQCTLSACTPRGIIQATGRMDGHLDFRIPGHRDDRECSPLFIPVGESRSLTDLAKERGARAFMHRASALDALCAMLEGRPTQRETTLGHSDGPSGLTARSPAEAVGPASGA